ncbi:MAG: N-6 DNA methylase [Sulfuritalea sp.]|nr:N-6 DNA methylase [Sulfuritalea sp.]
MNEWEFVGEVKSWIDQIVRHNPSLPFSGAKTEQRGSGSNKRRDLTILDQDGRPILTGEVKLPYAKDGTSPYRSDVVVDARKKAEKAGVRYFFTWNVNECVLWETASAASGLKDRAYERWVISNVSKPEHLEQAPTQHAIHEWLVKFLHEVAPILRGTAAIGTRSPDLKFVEALESALALPIRQTFEELNGRYAKPAFKRDLDGWMVSLGWQIVSDAEGLRELLERAAKFACYLLVNKLVFHEALLKKYNRNMEPLKAPPEVTTGDELRIRLQSFFEDAREVTGDYETIFGEDPQTVANRVPFYSDAAVAGWRALIEQIHEFDFSKLDYEIVGSIFERLIGPEERHKYGQFYTRVEVVDLINSFCINDGAAKVLDPACGGGTFLVRAYARKRELAANRKHRDLLSDIYGIDLSQFAAHLTTMNLATRDLVEDENYPCIGREDFFNVLPDHPFVKLPAKLKAKGLGKGEHRDVAIPPLDAVIANPPYVRQEELRKAKTRLKEGGPEPGTKEFYARRVEQLGGVKLSGRSDLHCYFWPHAATFLKEDGMLGFITSSQWLDVEYGFKLQKWLLENFEIIAILESPVEPWFVGARVSTAVTIARRCKDEDRRWANQVRFVQLRRPLADLLEHDGTTAGAVRAADNLRDEILALGENVSHNRYRARLVNQGELRRQGVDLGRLMRGEEKDEEEHEAASSGDYFGGKWGVHLRAPDLWFELLDRYGRGFAPLGQLAEIRFGVKSGKDEFFFPKDCSAECLQSISDPVGFEHEYGVPRKQVESGKVKLVMAGEKRGELHAIEAEYLEPEVHSLMEVKGFSVSPADCARMILLAPSPRESLAGTFALKYIEWGESRDYHTGSTCAQRVGESREWYDLIGHHRGQMFWPMAQQYKHAIPTNDHHLIANHNLFDVDAKASSPSSLAAILNSTIAILSKFQFGRPVGVEGNLKTEVIDVKMMLMPNPEHASAKVQEKLANAISALQKRKALQLIPEKRMRRMAFERAGKTSELDGLSDQCELDMPDRRALDHAVLDLIGIKSERERTEWINRLYDYLRSFFEETRQKEELAIGNKNTSKRKGAASPQDLAAQIAQFLHDEEPRWFKSYREFLREAPNASDFIAVEVPKDGLPKVHRDMLTLGVSFMRGTRQIGYTSTPTEAHAELLALAVAEKRLAAMRLPRSEAAALALLRDYDKFLRERDRRMRELIAERVGDEDTQARVLELLVERLRKGGDSRRAE